MEVDNVFLFATGNGDKRREFEELLGDFLNPMWVTYDLNSWPGPMPEIVEDQGSFRGNALKKAEVASLHTNATCLADDSGLVVDALDGRPGVKSARFAGPDATDAENNDELIEQLEGVPERKRDARYVAVLGLVLSGKKIGRAILERARIRFRSIPEGRPTEEATAARAGERVYLWFEGTVEGRVIDEPRGDGGFGYDPHFYLPDRDKTMAELSMAEKNEISHRAEAVEKMRSLFRTQTSP